MDKGTLAEQKVILRAIELGYTVSKPISSARYYLILDKGKLIRVQVKYGDGLSSNSQGAVSVSFRTWNNKGGGKKSKKYSTEEIDAICAYLPSVDKVVWLEPEKFAGKAACLIRIAPAKIKCGRLNLLEDLVW